MLELLDLSRSFGAVRALDGLTMRAGTGRLHGFVGRNGAGKTTAMRIVLGLVAPDAGEVRWRGAPLTAEDRRRIGYMPEERGLYPQMGAAEQVAYFGRLSGLEAGAASLAAAAVLDRFGLSDRWADKVQTLSLGNQQRVQLASALVHGPELLVLDEPFSGLDPVGVDVLAAALREEADGGAAIVFSSHQLELVERLCDEVTIIEAGRVVASGPVDAVRSSRAKSRLRVGLEGGWVTWADSIPGTRKVGVEDGDVVLELAPDVDDQAVLDAARAAGRVRSFRWVVPSLADIFRDVVTHPGDEPEEQEAA
jgi:ABC-2 type transport system ATP-binding protein